MRIRFYNEQGMFLDEFISKNEFISLSGICLLRSIPYEIIDVKPFIRQKDYNNQEYIRVILKRIE